MGSDELETSKWYFQVVLTLLIDPLDLCYVPIAELTRWQLTYTADFIKLTFESLKSSYTQYMIQSHHIDTACLWSSDDALELKA